MEQGRTQGDGEPDLTEAERPRGRVAGGVPPYAVAIALVAVASVAGIGLRPYLSATPDAAFFAAVALASWFGGLVPGLVATFASALAVD